MNCVIYWIIRTNKLDLLQTGIGMLSRRGRAKYEKSIDLLTIKKGFGSELKDWAQFSVFDSKANPEYKEFKKTYYLNPKEIDSLINLY